MFSVTSFIYVTIPVVLVIAAGMLIRKRGNPDTAGRRFFLFLIWTGVGLLAVILIENWLMGQRGPGKSFLLIPATSGVVAMIFLHLHEFPILRRGEKALFILALVLLVGLVAVPLWDGIVQWDVPQFLMAAALSNAVFLAIAWALGKRYPVLLGLLALICLALFNGAAIDTLSLPADPPPAWLPALSVVVFLALPGLVVATVAALASTGLRLLHSFGADARVSWKPAAGRLALAVLLLVYFAYTLVWVGIWDGTDDGIGALALMIVSFLAATAAGVVIGMTSTGGRRWLGLVSPVLVAVGVSWAAFRLGNSFSLHAITETRAARIQAAVERFRATTGRYPGELGELIPGELWWIPKPMILRGQGWCYQGGADYYRLGAIYREHWSSPLLSVRVYAAAGNPPGTSWSCDEKFAELNARYDVSGYFGAAPTPVPLPTSVISIQRIPVSPILRAASISVGSWSPHGEYLVFGAREFSGGQTVTGLYFLRAETGEVCQAGERKWATGLQSDGLYERFAWLPDGRLLYLSEAGELLAFKPCATEVEDLTSRYPATFTHAVSFDEQSGRVLLKNRASYWLLDGASLEARQIPEVTPNPNEFQSDRYAWSPGGERLVISRLNRQEAKVGSTLYVVDGLTGEVERSLPLDYASDQDAPIVEWLTRDELLVQGGGSLTVMDLRSDPPKTTDLIRDVFLLDIAYPTDFSSLDFLPNQAGDGYSIGVRVNHPRNQAAYVYASETGQVEVFQHGVDTLLFFPGGQWMRLSKWEDTPTYRDEYEMVWMDQPGETQRLVVEGHTPRSQPQIFPRYLPASSQLIFSSSQGVSLVSIPDGKTIRFWELAGGEGYSSRVYASPLGEALVVVADGDSLYYIPLPPGK